MKVYLIKQAVNWDDDEITGIFTDEEQAKKYAKKSFKDYDGWGNCIEEYEVNKYNNNVLGRGRRDETTK